MGDPAQAEMFFSTWFAQAMSLSEAFYVTTVCIKPGAQKKIQADSWRLTNIGACAAWCASASEYDDVYFEVGLSSTPVQGPHRHKAEDIVAVPGLWVDVDVKPGAAGDDAAALAHLGGFMPPANIIVDSGTGFHGYWTTTDLIPAQAAAVLAPGWVRTVAGVWRLDSVGDLARIMRVPGTRSHKPGARPVQLMSTTIPSYSVETLAAVIAEAGVTPPAGGVPTEGPVLEGTNTDIVAQAEALLRDTIQWQETLGGIFDNDPEVVSLYERHVQDQPLRNGWSDSDFDLALASRADLMGLDDATTAALMASSRLANGINPDNLQKAWRADYILRTIRRGKRHPRLQESSQQAFQMEFPTSL